MRLFPILLLLVSCHVHTCLGEENHDQIGDRDYERNHQLQLTHTHTSETRGQNLVATFRVLDESGEKRVTISFPSHGFTPHERTLLSIIAHCSKPKGGADRHKPHPATLQPIFSVPKDARGYTTDFRRWWLVEIPRNPSSALDPSGLENQDAALPPTTAPSPEFELDYNAFDQTPGQGWRKLAESGEFLESAKLIDSYFERNRDGLQAWQRFNLRFHAGQLYAFAADNETAVARFKESLNPAEPKNSPIRWNAYVNATIAFLERDRDQVVRMRDKIAQGPKGKGAVPNLDVVERLIRNFDQPYSTAYAVRQAEGENAPDDPAVPTGD